MRDQIKSLEEVVQGVEGHTKLVLIGFLDVLAQVADRIDGLEKQNENLKATMESVAKGGTPVGGGGGFSIG